jgi:transposase-like protein
LGGRKVPIRRPRVRTADDESEARLGTYEVAHAEDLLAEHMVGAMLAGLSTRRYPAALEPVGAEIEAEAGSTSKSSVSRRFVTATTDQLAELMGRSLEDEEWLIMFIDGFTFGDHLLVGALGVTENGTKVPLAVMEGTTENKTLVTRLLADLQDRGLDVSKGVLFVVDGSKALTKGIPAVFGAKAVIQRCRIHKEKNVMDHLPDTEHTWVRTKLRQGWANPDPDAARTELERLARTLQRQHPGAASSLREGLQETLAVTRLGITGALLKTVFSTNPVESMIEIVREHSSNVKRWRDGEMTLRWAGAGMESARRQFRRVKGYRQLPQLAVALQAATVDEPGLLDLRVTA